MATVHPEPILLHIKPKSKEVAATPEEIGAALTAKLKADPTELKKFLDHDHVTILAGKRSG